MESLLPTNDITTFNGNHNENQGLGLLIPDNLLFNSNNYLDAALIPPDVNSELESIFSTLSAESLNLNAQTNSTNNLINNTVGDFLTSNNSSQPLVGESALNLTPVNTAVPNQFDSQSGVFTVGDTGILKIDFLADGSKYEGELAIFSLEGMGNFEPDSPEFVQEAVTRALSNSELGYVVISDRLSGAKFDGVLGQHEKKDLNKGEYLGVNNFNMRPGDKFALMFVHHGKIEYLSEYPNQTGVKSPLFSLTTVDTEDSFPTLKLADVGADRQTFAIDETSRSDDDYNDLVFRIGGATGNAISIDEVINPDKDWRDTENLPDLVKEIVEPIDLAGNTPDEARKSLPSTAGRDYRGWVDNTDTEDYYAFSLGMSNEFDLSLDGLSGDANVEILDLQGNTVFSSTNAGLTSESISDTIEAGAYRLRVSSVDGISTAYKLNLAVQPTIEGITTTASEAPVYLQTVESLPLINHDDFISGNTSLGSRSEYAGIDGAGFSTVVIDTGIDLDHPFFGADNDNDGVADRIVFHFDYADNDNNGQDLINNLRIRGHGSNVASIIASEDANTRGVAPGVDVIALKVFTEQQNGAENAWIEQALQWVVANAEDFNIASVNMSLGGGNFNNRDSQDYRDNIVERGYADELAAIAARNVIVVAAAGNDYFTLTDVNDNFQIDQNETPVVGVAYPAADPNTIAVGAVFDSNVGEYNSLFDTNGDGQQNITLANTTGADRIAPFSQRHATLTDIFAPGVFITGANFDGGTIDMPGTSQAAPHIAGMAVLAQDLAETEVGRPLTPAEFRQLLTQTGTRINDGDDEDDIVPNTGLNFRRADMLALADEIMDLRPPNLRNIDLRGTNFNVVQEPLNAGNVFDVNFSIQNRGLDNAGAFDVNFYLSENNTITYRDTNLGTFRVNGIADGGTINATQQLTLPAINNPFWLENGDNNYTIGMIVDARNEIFETNESNNRNRGEFRDFDGVDINNTRSQNITVKVNRVKGDFDKGIRQNAKRGRSDFYAVLSIDGYEWRTPIKGGSNDFSPPGEEWKLTRSTTNPNVPIVIKLYDDDDGFINIFRDKNQHIDIDPDSGDKDINLTYNWITGEITGDFNEFRGQKIYARGGGDSDVGEIWFTIDSFA